MRFLLLVWLLGQSAEGKDIRQITISSIRYVPWMFIDSGGYIVEARTLDLRQPALTYRLSCGPDGTLIAGKTYVAWRDGEKQQNRSVMKLVESKSVLPLLTDKVDPNTKIYPTATCFVDDERTAS